MKITKIFKAFWQSEKTGGLLLLLCTAVSLWVANTAVGEDYVAFWHAKWDASFLGLKLNYTVEHWINDGLMTIFFLLVGLEIERELYDGELSQFRNALLPIGAAIGGMLVPAAFHYFFNRGELTQSGFGIPMATDIAFALGMMALLGKKVPFALTIFLTALAIIDDLGAIAVIAFFYNSGISWPYLGAALALFGMLMVFNKTGVKRLVFYLVPGVVMWYCMMQSGVHATITGVLLAFAIPFGVTDDTNPSYKLQHALHRPVAFFILPIFALANTGIVLNNDWYYSLSSPNSIGILTGLVLGKPLGILLLCWLFTRLGWARFPEGVSWSMLWGAGLLAGIGFTMSIFIANLAFTDPGFVQFSKVAVLTASFLATILGLGVLYASVRKRSSLTG